MRQINKKAIDFFQALADETRLKILLSIAEKSRSVNQIHNHLGKDKITLSAVSHQLKYLNNVDVVVSQKKGRQKIFSLSDKFCWCVLRDVLKHFD